MTDRRNRRALSKRPASVDPDYEVGYGKPPVHTRFKPGQSGNPLGRPKGARSREPHLPEPNEERLKRIILEEAYRPLTVRDGDRYGKIPTIRAILRSVALKAAQGNQRSQQMFTDLVQLVETERKVLADEWLKTAIEYKAEWERELYHREKTGRTGPEPLPHPDDIVIRMDTGRVEVLGPMTNEDKALWDQLPDEKKRLEEGVEMFENMLKTHPDQPWIKRVLKRIRKELAMIAYLMRE